MSHQHTASPKIQERAKTETLPRVGHTDPAVAGETWVRVGRIERFPEDAGIAVRAGGRQIAVFRFAGDERWYASDNRCPHTDYAVLARGIIGDSDGKAKVACPMHKRAFDLESGSCLGDATLSVRTYPVRVVAGEVEVFV